MKKLIIALLTLMLTLSVSMTAFATGTEGTNKITHEITDITTESTGNVNVTINPAATVYYVTAEWDNLDFTYNLGEWNPETHSYSNESGWNKTSANILVKNHSNTDITVDANFNGNGKTITNDNLSVKADLTVGGGTDKVNLASAENYMDNFENAARTTIIVTIDQTVVPKKIAKDKQVLGTIKVVLGNE